MASTRIETAGIQAQTLASSTSSFLLSELFVGDRPIYVTSVPFPPFKSPLVDATYQATAAMPHWFPRPSRYRNQWTAVVLRSLEASGGKGVSSALISLGWVGKPFCDLWARHIHIAGPCTFSERHPWRVPCSCPGRLKNWIQPEDFWNQKINTKNPRKPRLKSQAKDVGSSPSGVKVSTITLKMSSVPSAPPVAWEAVFLSRPSGRMVWGFTDALFKPYCNLYIYICFLDWLCS